MATFIQDNSVQNTTTSILSSSSSISIFAFTTDLISLSTNSTLSVNNLNATSTSILGLVNGHTASITNLNATSTTLLGYVNSLSTNSTLSINNNNTSITKLNATSTTLLGLVNGHTTSITNLNATSTTLLGLVNGHTTSITNLNATSTTLLGLVNGHTTSITNLNATSTTLLGLVNGYTTSITNLNATSTTILGYVNSLSTNSTLSIYNNNTSITNLNSTSTTILNLVNGHTTQITNLNATSTTILGYVNSLSTNSTLSIYNNNTSITNLNSTSTTILNLVNGHTAQITNLNATSTTILGYVNSLSTNSTLSINNLSSQSYFLTNYTNLNNLNVSGISKLNGAITCSSTLNVIGNIIGSGSALTNLNYNSLLNPPTIPNFNNACTLISTLFVSGNTILNNATTCKSTLNIIGNIIGSGTALTNLNYNAITNPPNLSLYLPLTGGTVTGQIIINTTNSGVILMNGSGAAFGQASGAGAYSSSAAIGDAIVRSAASSNLILQSGSGAGAIIINSSNNTIIKGNLDVNGILNANYPDIRINGVNGTSLLTLEGRIMGTNGYSACFGGDMYETSFWGKVICINGGGLGDNASAGAAKIPNTSSFSIYTRSSGASTFFDKNLFVVRNSGNVGIGTTNPSQLLDVRGGIITQSIIVGDSTSYSSQYQLLIIPPTSTTSAQIQTIQQGVNYNQNLNIQPYGGTITLTGATNCVSTLNVGGILTVLKNTWILSSDGILRIYFGDVGTTYFHSGNTGPLSGGFIFRNYAQGDILSIYDNGNIVSTGSISCSTINASGGSSFLGGLRLNGGDTGNTIWQGTGNLGISANTGYNIPFSIGNGNIITTITASGMTFKDSSYIEYPNILYFKNTTANKTITMSAGNLNVPVDLNVLGNINLSSSSFLTINNKWFIFSASANGVANSLIFNHVDTGINSYWWFSGTQTNTQADVSDERVKTDIEPITNGLNMLMKLQPKKFNVLNDKEKMYQYGFISQDIEQEIPNIIYNENHYIANIYDYGNINNKIVTMNKNINGLISIGDELKIILDNNDDNKEYLLNASFEYNKFKKRFVKVIDIIDDYTFEVDKDIYIVENRISSILADEIFIYGKYVEDFKTLKYNSLISINVAATQELYNIIKQLENRISILENK